MHTSKRMMVLEVYRSEKTMHIKAKIYVMSEKQERVNQLDSIPNLSAEIFKVNSSCYPEKTLAYN